MTNQPLAPTTAAPQSAASSTAGDSRATAQPPTPPGGNKDLTPEWDRTFQSEIDDIQRRHVGDPVTAARDNLIGLAFSGGGIRSATFGLGVLEALKHIDLLKRVHYLSTVSGGGYIGAWLSANTKRHPDWLSPQTDWQKSIAHLRRYSNYLSPELGFFSADTWSIVLVWLRNTVLVQATVMLAVATVLTVPRLLVRLFQMWPDVGNGRWATILLFLFAVVGIAGNEIRVISSPREVEFLKARRWSLGVGLSAVCAVVVAGLWWYFDFHPFQEGPVDVLPSVLIALFLVLAAFCLLPFGVQLVKLGHGDDPNAPTQINYTQGYVQVTVVMPIMASCFLMGAILWGETVRPIPSGDGIVSLATLNTFGGFFKTAVWYWPFPLAVVFCSLALLSFCTAPSFEEPADVAERKTEAELGAAEKRADLEKRKTAAGLGASLLATLVCVLVLHALLSVIMVLLHGWHRNGGGLEQAFVWAPTLVLFAFSLTIIVLIGMMGRQWTEGVREWWSRLGAWLSIYGSAWMLIAIVAVYGPQWVYTLFRDYQAASLTGLVGWIGTVTAGLLAGRSDSTGGQTPAGATSKPNVVMKWLAAIAPFAFIAALLIGVATGIDYIVWDNTDGQTWWTIGRGSDQSAFFRVSAMVFGGCVVALLIMAFRIDINEFSLSAFYRSRLVRCYLGATREKRQPQNFTGFDDDDDMPLANLIDPVSASVGPLHIINCALNLGGSSDLALHTRHSASFTLSPLNCGSDYQSRTLDGKKRELGYIPTPEYGGKAGAPTLGQAISVSGAAASPNMGYHTSPVVAFLLTVFNVRLGWWFPNPRPGGADPVRAKGPGDSGEGTASPAQKKAAGRPSPHFNLSYLFAELFGLADDKSTFLMISDGGHFENLAAYELVRRRCKVIIISDAEADPLLTFEGLGTLIRMCDVDFGAKIDLDVGSIRLGPRGSLWSTNRCAVGKIVYADKTEGMLIYLKASMTGHEDSATLQYKASHPTFPHESTGDQFYREDQFESYRRLGYDVTRRTFATALGEDSLPDVNLTRRSKDPELTVFGLAKMLKATCSPMLENIGRFTEHSERLMSLWERLSSTSTLGSLDEGVVGSALPADWMPSFRAEFYACSEMIQFMENVYLDLNLEQTWMHPDNEGWRKMFGAWAESPSLKRTWELSHKTFGLRFQYFCNRHFKLRVDG